VWASWLKGTRARRRDVKGWLGEVCACVGFKMGKLHRGINKKSQLCWTVEQSSKCSASLLLVVEASVVLCSPSGWRVTNSRQEFRGCSTSAKTMNRIELNLVINALG
jgi:hypothetical protein